jgi:flagellar biosynthetic protein FlhB
MDSPSQDRQLPASERKLKKARDDGQVSRSRDLAHLAVLGGGAAAIHVLGPWATDLLRTVFAQHMRFDVHVLDSGAMLSQLTHLVWVGLLLVVALALLVNAASIVSALATGGWVWSFKPLMPDFSRIHPFKGVGQLFSVRKLVDVAKMCLITSVLCVMAYLFLRHHLFDMASLAMQPSQAAVHQMLSWIAQGVGLMLVSLMVVAVIDVPVQMFLHRADMKMSRQEVKDEHKESEGNPQIKGRLRQRQRDMAQRRSITAVPQADFVVMNPTHFAVAIRYDEASMAAPSVVAKGADLIAMKIRDVANEHQVPVIQSPMLARALYANSDIGHSIPLALYSAVAQVLAYVYRLKAAMQGQGPMPGALPELEVPPELDPYTHQSEGAT